ncbi:MSH6 [Candida oxycetoniae]|uniref:DNA mismatch repair protein n=1 Tax=Candida oxycetoniae TaxID=497107 RepID=A0AAI9SYQ4_9ASCO|nr:MSH6 [Candida oxycetoniae]KAI3405668.2 MSH6 [Candida oxycetoniae]
MGKLVTPRKVSTSSPASQEGSSGVKQKQQTSLMSFFKPIPAKSYMESVRGTPEQKGLPLSSSPPNPSSRLKFSSDKENELYTEGKSDLNNSFTSSATSPPELDRDYITPSKKTTRSLNATPFKDRESSIKSSPVTTSRGRISKKINYAESEEEDYDDDDDGEGVQTFRTRKRKRIGLIESDSDQEADFKPNDSDGVDSDGIDSDGVDSDGIDSDSNVSKNMDDFVIDNDKDEGSQLRKKRKPETKTKAKNSSLLSSESNSSDGSSGANNRLIEKFNAASLYTSKDYKPKQYSSKPLNPAKKNFAKENEERYHWLVNIRDAEKRTPDDANYDSRTLYIPQSAWSKFTAFEKQYWEIKSKMWNTVVFFKKGKFYELYENDAIIANTEFDLKIAGGGRANMKLAGIPEMSFEHWAKEFISHGYKVAKVDQKESMLAKEMRDGGSKEEKIIKRELTGILTGGTLTNLDMITDDLSTYCLSIKEGIGEDGGKIFGVAFVDTATSELNMIELHDDGECTKLDTLITQVKPKEIVCEKGNLCQIATKILKFCAHSNNQIWNYLNPITEFWDVDITLEQLVKSKYYKAEDLDDFSNYPKVLLDFKENCHVAFNAFGGLLFYLKTLKLDSSIMSLGNINHYKISMNENLHMILDGITLNNLEILNNNYDGGDQGTLLKLINQATTPFGKRHLKKWVLHPLMKIPDINARYDSIDYLLGDGSNLLDILQASLTRLPDLERLLARIHEKTLKFKDFLRVIESFENIAKFQSQLSEYVEVKCGVLQKYLSQFPMEEMNRYIKEWEDAFDREEAKADIIVPATGVDEEFDNSQAKMKDLEDKLNQHLREYKREFRSQEICYRDSGKEIYLIEIPVRFTKHIPSNWETMGATSKVKRFWSPEVKRLARKLMEQRELHKMVCDTLKFRMYDKFDLHYETWMSVIICIANIDCILALTKVSGTIGYPSCRPEFIESEYGHIQFKELRHPCFTGAKEFIPNDIQLGGDEPRFGLLTGANAAGKSTIMRTTALAVILSQIGCYIPAESAKLTPVDRIMTRLGANDNIMQGKSTFFVELSETKKIVSNATSRSLVILDELGRGGSSSDGFAVAESVLHHLATHLQSIGFFATHYNSLGLAFKTHPQIKPLRMAIIVDQSSREITFLYKLEDGTALGSFGMNVALMCGVSKEIVDDGEIAAKKYEQISSLKKTKVSTTDGEGVIDMSLGLQSDCVWFGDDRIGLMEKDIFNYQDAIKQQALCNIYSMIDAL